MAICQLNHIAELFWTDLLSIFHASKLNKIGLIVLASVDHTHTACMLIVYGLDMYAIHKTHNKLLLRYNTFPQKFPFLLMHLLMHNNIPCILQYIPTYNTQGSINVRIYDD